MVATHCAVMCGLFVHALRCALLLVSLVFGELFFGESPSLHYLFLHFLAKCFFYTRIWLLLYCNKVIIVESSVKEPSG